MLYVPDFKVNLCSVILLARDGFRIVFEGEDCVISRNGQEAIRGVYKDLYMLQTEIGHEGVEMALKAEIIHKELASTWQKRLGHLNMTSFKSLESMAKGIHFLEGTDEKEVCSPCLEGKQHKVFNRHEPSQRMSKRLEMIHSDTCGPFRTPSKAGAKSFVLFIDDMTRMVWCFFMKSKTETSNAFKEFKALVEKHSGQKIIRFRCDNGKAEYDNTSFLSLLRENGITYEPSAPYTQNQNGVSERMNRTILEKARTMLLEACLPEGFWAEAVNTAVYLHNRSPTRSLEGVTPYEAWNGTKPLDLSNLRIFGCDAYLFVPDEKRGKLQAKSQKCVLMGYVWNTTKMWRLWDPTGRRVVIGSNVQFDENRLGNRNKPQSPPEDISSTDTISEIKEEILDTPETRIGMETEAIDDSSKGRFAMGMSQSDILTENSSSPTVSETTVDITIPEASTDALDIIPEKELPGLRHST